MEWVTVESLRLKAGPSDFDKATYHEALWRVAANKVPSVLVWLEEQKESPPFDALAAKLQRQWTFEQRAAMQRQTADAYAGSAVRTKGRDSSSMTLNCSKGQRASGSKPPPAAASDGNRRAAPQPRSCWCCGAPFSSTSAFLRHYTKAAKEP